MLVPGAPQLLPYNLPSSFGDAKGFVALAVRRRAESPQRQRTRGLSKPGACVQGLQIFYIVHSTMPRRTTTLPQQKLQGASREELDTDSCDGECYEDPQPLDLYDPWCYSFSVSELTL